MKSNSPEVRTLVQAIATKLVLLEVQMDSKGIGSALYGMYILYMDRMDGYIYGRMNRWMDGWMDR